MKCVKVVIRGKVHGVFFRANIQEQAEKHNIKGWVKNSQENGDQTLEATFESDPENIEKILEYCKKGPTTAQVESVEIREANCENFKDFKIIY